MPSTEVVAYTGLIIAFIAALFTALQWASAYRSAAEAKRSADAAERSAKAAEDSAVSTRALAETGQRPWILVEPDTSEEQAGDYTGWTVTVRANLRNRGNTPALDVRAGWRLELWALPVGDVPPVVVEGQGISLGPDLSLVLNPRPLFILDAQIEELSQRRLAVLFHGQCLYRDVFGQEHTTPWCLEYAMGHRTFTAFKTELNRIT